ncbi:MAG: competence/damage-inducible protein A [candidate division Zixibacteria bacterium]
MNVEIITIGDELVTGHTVDSNAAHICSELAASGFPVRYITTVGDRAEEMEEVFQSALKRADLVIATGGLGPTDDDITKRAIVKVFKRNLVFHEEILADLKARFARRGIEMPAINQNQALLPQGATLLPNQTGSAVGILITEQDSIFIALPGVPTEMKQILADEVIPLLKQRAGGKPMVVIKLRSTGIVESRLAEKIGDKLKLPADTRLAYLPSYPGVDLRVMAQAGSQQEAQDKAVGVARDLESLVGKYVYGRDDDSLAGVVGQLLLDNDKSCAVAESCTGGLLGGELTSVPGASRYFKGGLLAYDNNVKIEQLSVDKDIIASHGAVSEECAKAMAAGCRKLMATDYALSVTGIAGPDGGSEEKPVGTVWIGLDSAHVNKARVFHLGSSRDTIRRRAIFASLEYLRRDILDIT